MWQPFLWKVQWKVLLLESALVVDESLNVTKIWGCGVKQRTRYQQCCCTAPPHNTPNTIKCLPSICFCSSLTGQGLSFSQHTLSELFIKHLIIYVKIPIFKFYQKLNNLFRNKDFIAFNNVKTFNVKITEQCFHMSMQQHRWWWWWWWWWWQWWWWCCQNRLILCNTPAPPAEDLLLRLLHTFGWWVFLDGVA